MKTTMLYGIIRHFLTYGGGMLMTADKLTETQVDSLIGAILTIVGIVWSLVEKKKA